MSDPLLPYGGFPSFQGQRPIVAVIPRKNPRWPIMPRCGGSLSNRSRNDGRAPR